MSFGGMIFLNVHSMTGKSFNYGGYVGFGALFNDQARWCISTGGEAIIGRRQRFVIHAGMVLSQVDRLSPPYDKDVFYLERIDNVPTYRAWKPGFLLGLSWNL